jgi:serine/threonine-protein kinase
MKKSVLFFAAVMVAGWAVAVPAAADVVPSVVGAKAQDANRALLGKGFKVSTSFIDTPVKEHDGIVVKQDPAPGQKVNPGSVVRLAVNRFKDKPVDVPMVTNTPAQQASSLLLRQGFKVSSTYIDTPMKEKDGYISKQNPPAGQKANPGTVVRLEVYRFKEDPTVKVPKLVGMKCADASTALLQLGVKPSNGFVGGLNSTQEGLVARQAVAPGTSVKKGEIVSFDCFLTEKQSRELKKMQEKAKMQPQPYNSPLKPDSVAR